MKYYGLFLTTLPNPKPSQMPAILVEQAFMTNAGDEEKLADPAFRQLMAEKIYEGIVDYLKFMKK